MKNKRLETMTENADITINTCRANAHAAGGAFSPGKTRDCGLLVVTAGAFVNLFFISSMLRSLWEIA